MSIISDLVLEGYFRAVINTDKFGIITGWNNGAERIFQIGSMEIIGKNIQSLNANSFSDSIGALEFFRDERPGSITFASQWTTKKATSVNTRWVKHRWDSGGATGVSVTYIIEDETREQAIDFALGDIRKLIEERVLRTGKNSSDFDIPPDLIKSDTDIFEQLNVGFWAINANDGGHIYANRKAAELLSFGRSEFLSMNFTDIDLNFSRKNLAEISEIISLQGSVSFSSLQLSKRGDFIKVKLTIYGLNPNLNKQSHLIGFSVSDNDSAL